jgi:hypothetical protein
MEYKQSKAPYSRNYTIFFNISRIDIMLVSESHTTEHAFVKIPHYTIYYANHPDGTAHA